ncbi:MAG: 4-phosphoerythronate dehydrogenase [Lentisphaeria bacterium]|nr:4-phosphoerythronate dehydrogenase [Lentisphaeria bacterium]
MKIIADDKIPFLKGVLEPFAEVLYLPGKDMTKEVVKDADGIITRTRTKCKRELLEGSKVKIIASATIGYDHIDTLWCEENNILWKNAPGCNSFSVMQYMASLLLHYAVRNNVSLAGKTIGVIGVGNVGKKIAALGRIFGMNVLCNDPPRARKEGKEGFAELEEIAEKADFITFHVPLIPDGTDRTFHYADEKFFALLEKYGRRPFLINASRGEVVDNDLLKKVLKEKKILCGAALDVWENEPELDLKLLKLTDFATPHIAGYSLDGKANGTSMSVQEIAKYFSLPLTDFYPERLPEPDNASIDLSGRGGRKVEEILLECMDRSYNILEDDKRLRESPETFEKQRGSYPFRREMVAYTVKNAPDSVKESLKKLGFTVLD